eukprot:5100836-Ditylum_brightwellii.AAC.2
MGKDTQFTFKINAKNLEGPNIFIGDRESGVDVSIGNSNDIDGTDEEDEEMPELINITEEDDELEEVQEATIGNALDEAKEVNEGSDFQPFNVTRS